MNYQVLARKYRPRTFGELIGQEHIARALVHAIERKRVAHAYLFSGARGVGKTSVARILSQALNCTKPDSAEPCGACDNCTAIAKGMSLAVWEIDGASNNSVDDVRQLIESARNAIPSAYNFRVFIIDEVHMLSIAAFNALLKTLEEPPPRTVFILATTELQKVPDTVLSRCQRYDFRLVSPEAIGRALAQILEREGISFEQGAVALISRLAEGSLRDGLSLLDRVVAYCGEEVRVDDASRILGVVNKRELFALSRAIISREVSSVLEIISKMANEGGDTSILLREFVIHWRELLLSAHLDLPALTKIGISELDSADLKDQVRSLDTYDLQELNNTAREESERALRGMHPWYAFEALVIRMATRERYVDLETLFKASGNASGKNASPASTAALRSFEGVSGGQHRQVQQEFQSEKAPVLQGVSPRVVVPTWSEFLDFASRQRCTPFLLESLKRSSMQRFSQGTLSLISGAFEYKTISSAENSKTLKALLVDYSGIQQWNIELKEQERVRSGTGFQRGEAVKEGSADSGDVIFEALNEVFPGCRVEAG
jgi:DNA polymerase-3 subunit gamma/tau